MVVPTYAEPTEMDIEKIKAKCMRDAEEAFSKELRRLGVVVEGGSESYHTASSRTEASLGEGQRGAVPGGSGGVPRGVDDGGRRDPDPPPGLNHAKINFDVAGGPTVCESLRHLELPSLPHIRSEGAALQFGDWLTMATPLMSGLGASSKNWWIRSLMVAEDFYGRWLESTPLERLRHKPAVEIDPGYTRLEQRGISMLLGILPEALRRDIVGARNVSTVSILYRLFVVYQPGGGAERTSLLKSLTEVRVGTTVHDVLGTIRLWRRWVARALELKGAIPDPLILMQVLGKMSDAVGKLGGAQVSYRLASVRQELQVDQRPLLLAVQEYSEFCRRRQKT